MIEFHIPIIPRPQKRARHGMTFSGHSVTYKDAGQRQNESDMMSLMLPLVPRVPMSGPLEVSILAVFPVPVSWSKKKKELASTGKILMTSKPDLDNLEKFIADLMTTLRFWDDDRLIVSMSSTKAYESERHGPVGWTVSVKEIDIQS